MLEATRRSTPAFAIGAVPPAFSCICCGVETIGYHFLDVRGLCPSCCSDHDYEYDRYERRHLCVRCEAEREYEAGEDDVCIFGHGTGEPVGTPLSQLSGRPGMPGFDHFCAIAGSWGYE